MNTNLEHTWWHLWERSSPMGGRGEEARAMSGGLVGGRENKIAITTNQILRVPTRGEVTGGNADR